MKEFKFFQKDTKKQRVNVNPYRLTGSTFNPTQVMGNISNYPGQFPRLRQQMEIDRQRIQDSELKYYWERRLLPSLESNIVLKPTWWVRIKMFFQSIKIKLLYDETF
jgi:hypothetical protein